MFETVRVGVEKQILQNTFNQSEDFTTETKNLAPLQFFKRLKNEGCRAKQAQKKTEYQKILVKINQT